jgi:hypothetical protein
MSNDLTTVWMSENDWVLLPIWAGVTPEDKDGTQYRGTYGGTDYVVTLHKREDGSAYSSSARVVFT